MLMLFLSFACLYDSHLHPDLYHSISIYNSISCARSFLQAVRGVILLDCTVRNTRSTCCTQKIGSKNLKTAPQCTEPSSRASVNSWCIGIFRWHPSQHHLVYIWTDGKDVCPGSGEKVIGPNSTPNYQYRTQWTATTGSTINVPHQNNEKRSVKT